MFFLFANIFPSQFEPLFGLPSDTLFVEYFEVVQKARSTCSIGIKTLGYASRFVPCFYRVIQTRVEVWEDEKCCGNTSRIPQLFRRLVFPQHFRVLSNFHELTKSKDYRDIWLSSDCASFRHRSVKYLRFSVNIAERFRT